MTNDKTALDALVSSRDENGKFQYNGKFNRVCICGHTLGAHIHGGRECGTNALDFPESKNCECQKFKQKDK